MNINLLQTTPRDGLSQRTSLAYAHKHIKLHRHKGSKSAGESYAQSLPLVNGPRVWYWGVTNIGSKIMMRMNYDLSKRWLRL